MERFSDIINKAAKLYGDREADVFDGTRLSNTQLVTQGILFKKNPFGSISHKESLRD